MSSANGSPVEMNTVVDGVTQGQPAPVKHLAQFPPAPYKIVVVEWSEAEASTGMSVIGDPNASGLGGPKFIMIEFLRPTMGDLFTGTPYIDHTDEDKVTFEQWCEKFKWHMPLRPVGYEANLFRLLHGIL